MLLHKNHAEVLTIIAYSNSGITTPDILKEIIEYFKDSAITDPEQVSKIVYILRGKGYITTSDAGKKKPHKITKKGHEALKDNKDSADELQQFSQETPKTLATVAIDEQKPTLVSGVSFPHDAIAQVREAGFTILDPLDELHSPFITIINAMEAANQIPSISINHKCQKIDTLNRLGNLFSDDIKTVFDDIITDLTQLEELA